jgi:hypothetical protein
MACFRNSAVNLLNLHYGIHAASALGLAAHAELQGKAIGE